MNIGERGRVVEAAGGVGEATPGEMDWNCGVGSCMAGERGKGAPLVLVVLPLLLVLVVVLVLLLPLVLALLTVLVLPLTLLVLLLLLGAATAGGRVDGMAENVSPDTGWEGSGFAVWNVGFRVSG